MMLTYKIALSLLVFVLLGGLTACDRSDGNAQPEVKTKTHVVKKQRLSADLYFSGQLKPLKQKKIASPADGVVVKRYFDYGQPVTEGQVLFKLNSNRLESEYHSALGQYLTAKDKFAASRSKYKSSKSLYEQGIIPRDELKAQKQDVDASRLSYLQSVYNLDRATRTQKGGLSTDLESLNISDVKAIKEALKFEYDFLDLSAPTNGIALMAPKDADSSKSTPRRFDDGSPVKLGQVLVVVGDLSGYSVSVRVNEVDIDQIKVDQSAEVSFVAFPSIVLKGQVHTIDTQASTTSGELGGLATFPAKIVIEHVTPEQVKKIRLGMSVKVKVNTSKPGTLMIPIDAVFEEKGQAKVKLLKEGKTIIQPVTTGETTFNEVEVLTGLNEGDTITYEEGDIVKIND